jgi:tetratricopeptide (TPR) repeat protein
LLIARAGFEARRQRTDDALAWYKRALALDANRADVWLGMGIAAVYGSRPELALDYAAKAAALAPADPEALVVKAMAHALLGQREAAREAAGRARALAPGLRMPEELERLLGPE